MPTVATSAPQLDRLVRDTPAYQKALARDDVLRPILQGRSTLAHHSRATGIPYHTDSGQISGAFSAQGLSAASMAGRSPMRAASPRSTSVCRLTCSHRLSAWHWPLPAPPVNSRASSRQAMPWPLTIGGSSGCSTCISSRLTSCDCTTTRRHRRRCFPHRLDRSSTWGLSQPRAPTAYATPEGPPMCSFGFGPLTRPPLRHRPAGGSLHSSTWAFARGGSPSSEPSSRRGSTPGLDASRPLG